MNFISIKRIFFWAISICIIVPNAPVIGQEFHMPQKIFKMSPEVAKIFGPVNLPRDMVIKSAGDTGPDQWKKLRLGDDVSIFLDLYKVKEGDSVSSILKNGSIRADENSISIFQILNPNIEDTDRLEPGQDVVTPKVLSVKETDTIQHFDDYALFYDYKTRRSLKETSKDLNEIEHDIEKKLVMYDKAQDDTPFDTMSYQDAFSLKASIRSYNEKLMVAARNPKVPSFLRKEINAESRALAECLSNFSKNQGSEKTVSSAISILNNSSEKINDIYKGKIKTVKIIVHTRFENGEQAPNMTIIYAPSYLADFDSSHMEFPKPTTPTEQDMWVADWLIWAMKGGSVMSDRKPIDRSQLITGDEYEIELIVKKP